MEAMDRGYLAGLLKRRHETRGYALRAYLAGRIDGHCLQNAIDEDELCALAQEFGLSIDWPTAVDERWERAS